MQDPLKVGVVLSGGQALVMFRQSRSQPQQVVQFCHGQEVALTRHLEATTSSLAFSMASKHGIRSICTSVSGTIDTSVVCLNGMCSVFLRL